VLKLVRKVGDRELSLELATGRYIIGRSDECHLVIPDPSVSRQHAVIELLNGNSQFLLTDSNSHNGTYVNGSRLKLPTPIKAGDRVSFGAVEFAVQEAANVPHKTDDRSAGLSSGESNLQTSRVLPIDEALKPLPSRIADAPEVINTLIEMAKILVLPGPKEEILDHALELVARVFPAERYAILLKDGSEMGVCCASAMTVEGKNLSAFSLSKTLINDIISNRNSIVVNDIQQAPRFAQQMSIVSLGMQSAAAVPLFDEGEILGVLYIDTRNPRHRYSEDTLRLLATFGNLIASRLLNYSLLEERQQRRLMEAELERASSIQSSLLPAKIPEIPGYDVCTYQKQSQLVGGDFYDVATLADGRTILMVGDVSGKGMGAALLMSDILGSFRVLYYDRQFELSRAVEIVSRELCKHSAEDHFATLFIGILDTERHTLEYINAGHNPPYFCRQSGERSPLHGTGIMMGAFDGVSWEQRTAALAPDDLLLIYTDGLTEAQRQSEFYGEGRLLKALSNCHCLSTSEVIASVRGNVEEFILDTPLTDDITLLALKRVSR